MKPTEQIRFEKVGGSYQPIVKTAADMKRLLDISETYFQTFWIKSLYHKTCFFCLLLNYIVEIILIRCDILLNVS